MADLPVRLAFYLAEAIGLAIPICIGLQLAHQAARRSGVRFPAVTWRRGVALVLGLAAVDTAVAELVGPQVILQYYLAGAVLMLGGAAWVVSAARGALAARRRAP